MNYKIIPINEIELDLDNPRIKQYLEMYGDNVSSEGIALALSSSGGSSSSSTYTALKESIRVNQGLINPIIINKKTDGRMVVVEGNTRLQIYKEFAQSDPDGPWKNIIAIVYDDLPENQIHAIRLQTHLVGPRDWDPFSKAKYLHQLSDIDKLPMELIISFCGGKSSEIRNLIDAYVDMTAHYFPVADELGMDPDPREFSKFAEFQKSSVRHAVFTHNFTKDDFAKWVANGNVDNAQNVRKIPAILANSQAKEIFLKSNISEAVKCLNISEKGLKTLEDASLDELVVELTVRLRNIGFKEVQALSNDPRMEPQKTNMKDLEDELKSLLSYVEGDQQ